MKLTKRNAIEIGRFFACTAAIVLMIYIPLRMKAAAALMNFENYAKACTEAFAEDIDSKGMIELNDYERFVTKLQLTDTAYDIELKVGRHLNTVEGDGFYEVFYNNEIADSLYLYGSFMLKKKDMVTINIKSGKGSVMASILALFGKNGALTEEYTIGWSH